MDKTRVGKQLNKPTPRFNLNWEGSAGLHTMEPLGLEHECLDWIAHASLLDAWQYFFVLIFLDEM